jgi:dynein light chain LC8-type
MERPEAEYERTRRGTLAKNKGKKVLHPPRHKLALQPLALAPSNEVKLAAIAVDLNVRLRSAEMPPSMQERAFRYAKALLDANPGKKPSPTRLAMCLKKVCQNIFESCGLLLTFFFYFLNS